MQLTAGQRGNAWQRDAIGLAKARKRLQRARRQAAAAKAPADRARLGGLEVCLACAPAPCCCARQVGAAFLRQHVRWRQADLAQVARKMRQGQATEARAHKDGMDPGALALLNSDLKQDRSERTLDEAAVQVGRCCPCAGCVLAPKASALGPKTGWVHDAHAAAWWLVACVAGELGAPIR